MNIPRERIADLLNKGPRDIRIVSNHEGHMLSVNGQTVLRLELSDVQIAWLQIVFAGYMIIREGL